MVTKVSYNGKLYVRDTMDVVYDIDTRKSIGFWDIHKNTINLFAKKEDSKYETEENTEEENTEEDTEEDTEMSDISELSDIDN